jgi:acyl carrier protein phosphodiesterase
LNYLAHFALSATKDQLIGQFIADDYKGSRYLSLPESIAKGVLEHRRLDVFTDNHSEHAHIRSLVRPILGKYAGVATDVYFDHILAKEWTRLYHSELRFFVTDTYQILAEASPIFSERAKNMLYWMQKHDWLNSYAHREGIEQVFQNMARRIGNNNPMALAASLADS